MRTGDGYRRRYWPLVLWILMLTVGMGLIAHWAEPLLAEENLSRLVLAFAVLALDLLMFLIWRLEAVYWFSGGPDFGTAKEAGSQRRRRYAWRHLRRFLIATVPVLSCLAVGAALGWPFWLDLLLFCVAVLAVAISTVNIRF